MQSLDIPYQIKTLEKAVKGLENELTFITGYVENCEQTLETNEMEHGSRDWLESQIVEVGALIGKQSSELYNMRKHLAHLQNAQKAELAPNNPSLPIL